MSKKYFLVKDLILSFLAGIGIGHSFSLLVSAFIIKDSYDVVVPEFSEMIFENEILAATISALICGVLGVVFYLTSNIWKKEEWSIIKKTTIYYFSTIIPTILAGTFLRWFNVNIISLLIFIGIFTLIFIAIWVIMYFIMKEEIKKINAKLKEKKV